MVIANGNALVDDATASFDDLALAAKKKKKKSKKDSEKKDEDGADGEAAADGGFDDLAAVKKKKKAKKAKTEDAAEDFDAKLAKAGGAEKDEPGQDEETVAEDGGDMDEGTGIWSHNGTQPIGYDLLLSRFFTLLNAHNPDLMTPGSKNHKIPPPQCLREGNKKTIFANIPEICRRMKRSEEHVTSFLCAELGTTGNTDGSRRLVIKGKFLQKQIENVLRRYIGKYTKKPPPYNGPVWLTVDSRICHLQNLSIAGY